MEWSRASWNPSSCTGGFRRFRERRLAIFGFLKKQPKDDELCRQFVRRMFELGRDTCPSVAEGVQTSTGGKVHFPVNDAASLEVSLAIMGTALAVLDGHSQLMSAERGRRIAAACKRSIETDDGLPIDSARKMNEALEEYQVAFQRSMASQNNPFGEVSGMMLVRCMGKKAMALCLPGTGNLNPLTHQIIRDLTAMTVTQALTFWKGK